MSRLVGLVLAAGLMQPGCAVNGLSFVQDDRVTIVEPKTNASVLLPFQVQWTVKDFDGTFAVFFDRSPMRPNQSLLSIVPDDDPCRARLDCPDGEWLSNRSIFLTKENRLIVQSLPDLRDSGRSQDRHDVTIALLDNSGRRVGESAFTQEFIIQRGTNARE